MGSTWIVVHFHLDQSVEAIPKSWYLSNSNEVMYPPESSYSKSEILNLIKRNDPPSKTWNTFTVTLLGGEYDNFKRASIKANKARDTDSISSHSEAEKGRGKRSKRPRKFSTSSLSTSDSNHEDDTSSIENALPNAPKKKQTISQFIYSLAESKKNDSLEAHFSPKTPLRKSKVNNSLVSVDQTLTPSSSHDSTEAFQKQVLRLLNVINGKISQLSEDVNFLMQQHNRNKENKDRDINSSSELSETLALFPIKNVEDLEKVENLIKAKQYLEDGLAKDLSRIGGENSVKITKRIMYRVMTNEVGQLFSFEGAKGKNIFKNLTLFSTIIKAVRLNAQTSDATDMDIVNTIKLWLAHAKNRLKNKRSQMNDEGEEN